MLIDCHAHLDNVFFNKDRDEVLEKSISDGVSYIINGSIDYKTSIESVNLANKYNFIYASVGIHPLSINSLEAYKINQNILEDIRQLTLDKRTVAIGEIGLDYRSENCNKDFQREFFQKQLTLAKEVKLPVIVHARSAHDDTLKILNNFKNDIEGGIIHGFMGEWDIVKAYLAHGLSISLGCNITYNENKQIKEVIKNLNLQDIVVETDSPFFSPEPYRTRRNYPGNLNNLIQYISEVKNIEFEKVVEVTTNNAKKIFRI